MKNFNLGIGRGYSVLEVINAVENITGLKIDYKIGNKRDGDPAELVAGVYGAIKILKWKPLKPALIDQIADAWNWHQNYFR